MQFRIIGTPNETIEEEQETLGCDVVPRSVEVCPMKEDFVDPLERLPQFATSPPRVEQTEDVSANNRVEAWSSVVKISLSTPPPS